MIYDKLYPWQKSIVDKFKEKDSFGLFLDMGLGKTPLSLAFAEQNNCQKVIVITINSKACEDENVDGSWLYWAKQSNMNYVAINKWQTLTDEDINKNEVFIINYEGLFSRAKDRHTSVELKDNIKNFICTARDKNVAIIIDESHKVKNLKSTQTKAIKIIQSSLKRYSKNVFTYLLSGTPFTTGYIDLYSQLKLLGYQDTKGNFENEFCIKGQVPGLLGWQQPIVGYKNIEELFRVVHQYAITIKSDDIVDLPEQIFINHIQPWSHDFTMFTSDTLKSKDIADEYKTRKIDKDLNEEYLNYLANDKKMNNPFFRNIAYPNLKWFAETNGTFWLRARQLSIGFQGNAENCLWFNNNRLDMLEDFLKENKDNYVIFYNYTPELLKLFDICDKLGYNIDVYCGEVKSLNFYEKFSSMSDEQKLQSNNNVIIANFASGSTGMNWQEYSHCIIFSVPLYDDYAQAIKRLHRIGQKNTVFYHLFYQNNWLDKGMIDSLTIMKTYNLNMFEADLRAQQLSKETKNGTRTSNTK